MKRLSKSALLLAVFYFSCVTTIHAQETDNTFRTVMTKPKKNIVKLNITSGLLYDLPLLIEYERLLSSHTSMSIQLGYSRLPFETNIDSLRFTTDIKSSGYSATLDYRFYLRRENKDPAPHGIYLAPFVSYFHFENERDLALLNDTAMIPLNVKSKYNFLSVGGALGYQFTLGRRWVLDCLLLGPSISYYQVEMKMTGSISESEMNDIQRDMLEALAGHFPLLNKLLSDDITSFTGSSSSWNYGFRYSIHVGYRF